MNVGISRSIRKTSFPPFINFLMLFVMLCCAWKHIHADRKCSPPRSKWGPCWNGHTRPSPPSLISRLWSRSPSVIRALGYTEENSHWRMAAYNRFYGCCFRCEASWSDGWLSEGFYTALLCSDTNCTSSFPVQADSFLLPSVPVAQAAKETNGNSAVKYYGNTIKMRWDIFFFFYL